MEKDKYTQYNIYDILHYQYINLILKVRNFLVSSSIIIYQFKKLYKF